MTQKTGGRRQVGAAPRSLGRSKRDPWFDENLELAREGDEAAIDILWKQYGIDYEREGGRFE